MKRIDLIASIGFILIIILSFVGCQSSCNNETVDTQSITLFEKPIENSNTPKPTTDLLTTSLSITQQDIYFILEAIDKYINVDLKKANILLESAFSQALQIQDLSIRDNVLLSLVRYHIKLKEYDTARNIAELMQNNKYHELVTEFIKVNLMDTALNLALKITDPLIKCSSLMDIANKSINMENKESSDIIGMAYTSALQIKDITNKDDFIRDISLLYCDIGFSEKAIESSTLIKDNGNRYFIQSKILSKTGDRKKALLLLIKAQNSVMPDGQQSNGALFLQELASQYVELGQFKNALDIVNSNLKTDHVRFTEALGPYLYVYKSIIEKANKSGSKSIVREVYSQLHGIINHLYLEYPTHSDFFDFQIYTYLIIPFIDTGFTNEASKTIDLICNITFKSSSYVLLAEKYRLIGDDTKSLDCLRSAVKSANKLTDSIQKSNLLLHVSEKYIVLHQYKEALGMLQDTVNMLTNIGTKNDESITLIKEICQLYCKAGYCDKALSVAGLLSPAIESETLISLSNSCLLQSQKTMVTQLANKADKIVAKILEPEISIPVCINLAILYSNIGDNEKAFSMLGHVLEKVDGVDQNDLRARLLIDVDIAYSKIGYIPHE